MLSEAHWGVRRKQMHAGTSRTLLYMTGRGARKVNRISVARYTGGDMQRVVRSFYGSCLGIVLLALSACETIAPYNAHAYELATSTKAEALSVVSNATDKYPTHALEVQTLKLNVEKAYEYAKGIPKNEDATKQWEIVMNESGGGLYAFLKDWKQEGKFSQSFVSEKKQQIEKQFDQIIGLEGLKRK
jgi:hypothetical protein